VPHPLVRAGQAEVGNFGRAVLGQQDVVGRQVAVHDAPQMGRVDRASQRLHQLGRLARRLRLACDALRQAASLDQLERQKRLPVHLADVIQRHDVRMRQLGDDLGFVAKAGQLFRRRVFVVPQRLDGHQPIERSLPRPIDHAHASQSENAQRLVAGKFAEPRRRRDFRGANGSRVSRWRI
jgi:hypothetical protein